MKKLLSIFLFSCLFISSNYGQSKDQNNFTQRMNDHITRYLSDDTNMAKAKELYGHTCDKHHVVTEQEIKARAAEAEKHAFIQANMDEYMKIYFPDQQQYSPNTTVTICDNGGFEQDFLNYTGFRSEFTQGSNTCNPYNGSYPSVFTQIPMPSFREFEIMTPGIDPLTGIQHVKFGTKSIKINDLYNHTTLGSLCNGDQGVNRLKKEFLVTKENREFTVWYSIGLENPNNNPHINQQPFFSIACDLAPYTNLCFDAAILECDSIYNEPGCTQAELIDVLDWTCHRIKIPESQIGNIATLEITMADCGQGGHNGYAYIDGICEGSGCTGSALGSITLSEQSPMVNGIGIDYISCNADKARICGSYSDPTLCGTWQLDSIVVPGFNITNVTIDTINKKFCFEINKSELGSGSYTEIFVAGYFKKNGGGYLPVVFSNSINLYPNLFQALYSVDFNVLGCNDNKTATNISDDYYMVQVKVNDIGNVGWDISRRLLDPYPNESGISYITSGLGVTSLILGPFLIQEGSWEMIVNIGNCTYKYIIDPPDFCSGCNKLRGIDIYNVSCIPGPPDQWSFTLNIPSLIGGTFKVEDLIGNILYSGNYGTPIPITNALEQSCVSYVVRDGVNFDCFNKITICPPTPCSDLGCDLDVQYQVKCETDSPNSPYTVMLNIDNNGSNSACFVSPNTFSGGGVSVSSGGQVGPFTSSNVTLVIYTCPGGGCSCKNPTCFKVINVTHPDCGSGNFNVTPPPPKEKPEAIKNYDEVKIIPNPINGHELTILSNLDVTKMDVLTIDGRIIHSTSFSGTKYTWDMSNYPIGIYILQYLNKEQRIQSLKFVKK